MRRSYLCGPGPEVFDLGQAQQERLSCAPVGSPAAVDADVESFPEGVQDFCGCRPIFGQWGDDKPVDRVA